MTTEEFQKIVLEELKNLRIEQQGFMKSQERMEERQERMEERQERMEKNLNAVVEQTADLTEFRYEVQKELAEIKNTISRIEIATADNWSDIARLKSII